MEHVAIDRVQFAQSHAAREGLRGAVEPVSRERNRAGDAHTRGLQYTDVQDTPENRTKIENAITALKTVAHAGETPTDTRYQFRMHSESGRLQVALVNYKTGETVEEIPSSKLLEFSRVLEELSGLIIDKDA